MSAAAPALRLEGVGVRYGHRTALEAVTFEARPGELVALAGPNGSGKSTLLRVALGLVATEVGEARLFGDPVRRLAIRERARRVAWVPQEETLRDNVRIADYVLYGRFARLGPFDAEGPDDRAAAREALQTTDLLDRAEDGVLEVSGGERQRLVFARALAQSTPLLLLDEPTAHLDIGHQLDLLARVRDQVRSRGLAAVAAIHDLNLAARFADRIVVLSRGRIVADGPATRVLSAALLRSVWGVEADLRTDARSGIPFLLPRLAVEPPRTPLVPGLRPVHVVGGGGAASEAMRALAEGGVPITAGALHLLDSDAETAEALGVPVALEAPFAPLSGAVRARNRALLGAARAIVLAPFATGPSNLGNLEDVLAASPGVPVLLLAPVDVGRLDYADGRATAIRTALRERGAVEVASIAELVERIRTLPGPDPGS